MGKHEASWQGTVLVLGQFSPYRATARSKHRRFVALGIAHGRRQDLVGGGLMRSRGGWEQVEALPRGMARQRGRNRHRACRSHRADTAGGQHGRPTGALNRSKKQIDIEKMVKDLSINGRPQ
jgi:hypothetical protein